ncbi:MAG TPA: hypothetical protein VFR78_24180 [Pyrinomonadaceae bacterium]|nr:hypothetical protein [Pyrinomonadaceae bacterium]
MVEEIIGNVLIVIGVSVVVNYLTRAALRSKPSIDPATGARIFAYARGSKVLAVISLILPGLPGALAVDLYRRGEPDLAWLIVFFILAALSAATLLECFLVRLVVSEEGIRSLSPWTGERFLRWDEIESIRYSQICSWYVIMGAGRKKIYASEYLNGFGVLVDEFAKKIPEERWIAQSREKS